MLSGKPSPVRLTLRPVRLTALCLLLPWMLTVISLAAENSNQANRTETSSAARPNISARVRVNAAYADLPLSFEPNVGQIRGDHATQVQFLSRGSGYTLYLTGSNAVLALRSRVNRSSADVGTRLPWVSANESFASSVLRMRLVGASPGSIVGIDELPGKSNYLAGNDPHNWHTGIPNFGQVIERGVYPGIDLRYHGNQTQIEYDFDVAAGADAGAIRLAFEGARALRIDSHGDLLLTVDGGELRFRKPVAYQEAQGVRHIVASRFVLKHKNQVAFRLARYDARQPLIIDPILAYSTYLGGSSIDGANGIAVAPDGTAFIAGGTFSSDFPTAHPLQPNAGGPADFPQDAFVSKIGADGSTLIYSTYLGGENTDIAYAIAVDASGDAYVTGTTDSPDFPVTPNAWDTLCGGDGKCGASYSTSGLIVFNGFVSKLNPAGSALLYSGLLGNYQTTECFAIAVDNAENAYVTGDVGPPLMATQNGPAPTFPIVNAFQTAFGGSADAFVTKIDATGSQVLYSSYLGGSGEDIGYGIAADTSANAYVTGLTYSADLPITVATALQSSYAGAGDAFLTKVNTNGTGAGSLVFSTYVGGSGLDQGNGIAVDSSGNAYLAGGTTSTTLGFAPPAGAYQAACALDSVGVCEGDAFMAKLNPVLTGAASLTYFTYLGGSLADSASGVAVDTSGDVYLTGSTVSTDFPTGPTGVFVFQSVYGGGNADAFVAELNPVGGGASDLVYSTYLGGSNTDSGNGIALNPSIPASSCPVSGTIPVCDAYLAGQTCSLDFPLANPLQPSPGGNCDAFISEISVLVGIALNPAGLFFPTQSVGTTSQPLTVTLTNGDAALAITSIAVTGTNATDFAQTNTCGTSVPAGGQCTISVTFTPSQAGIRKASISITDSAPGSPQVVNLTGSTSTVTLSSSSLSFGSQTVGVTSGAQAVTVTNNGTTPLTISSITASGDFAETNDCSVPLQPTTNCVINVTYTPLVPGSSVGALTISDNAVGSPQVVLLTGTGVLQPTVVLSNTSLTFTSQIVGTTSVPQTVTVTNAGSAPLTISSIVSSGAFSETNSCVSAVAPGGVCTVSVSFTPTTSGIVMGTLTLTDNAATSPQTISLTGTGALAPIVSLTPASLTLAAQSVGTRSAAQSVTVANTGSAALVITSIVATGDFAETNSCGASVAAGGSCSISVTFAPSAVGSRYGTVTLTDSAANSPQTITLAGTGLAAPALTLSAASLSFSSQAVGTVSAAQSVTLTNSGTAAMSITSIATSGDFPETGSCGLTLAVKAACTISITFSPTAAGSRTGALTITDNAPGSPQVVQLGGTGVPAPTAALSATSLTFAGQPLGSTSASQNVTLTNTGSTAMVITNIVATGDFVEAGTCGASLSAGAGCTISVSFKPTAVGSRYGTVTVTDSAANSPQTITLAGTGLAAPSLMLSPTSLSFSSQAVGTVSAAQSVTLTNSGTAAMSITSIAISGDFSETGSCGLTLAMSAACTISITFSPTAAGSRTGALTITDNAPGSPQVVTLGGLGSDFALSVSPPSATVIAGNSLNFTVTVSPKSGFSAAVALSCSGLPSLSSCSASPASVTPGGTTSATSTLTISTAVRSSLPNGFGRRMPWPPLAYLTELSTRSRWFWLAAMLILLACLSRRAQAGRRKGGALAPPILRPLLVLLPAQLAAASCAGSGKRPISSGRCNGAAKAPPFHAWAVPVWAALAVTVLVLLGSLACGGGGNGYTDPTGTPAGTYQVTVLGTSGTLSHSVTVALTVK